jgi:acyl carrier protein
MSTDGQITDQLKNFILERFPIARKHGFASATPLLDSGLLDSLGILEVVGFVEQKFGILLSDEDLVPENFQTVGHLSAFLLKKQAAKQAPTA